MTLSAYPGWLSLILADPLEAPLPLNERMRIQVVLGLSNAHVLSNPDETKQIIKYVERLPLETQVFFLYRAVTCSEQFRKSAAFVKMIASNHALVSLVV